ncbi:MULTISPECIES: hypothetical protein [Pseudomonas]|uniref:Terminase small subunit n=1 Tax=Pseudomonas indica TaxID=137658 RepID=A0A1G9M493_9PSED|nr:MULTISPECIES: hypothetical protein [Pseudomonas]MBU3059416.1 hypothetical protein [Pseudomonas indica]PAU59709.1 hypothetical protein BZL41_16385 [Pseudomonas sp. PIC25]PAU63278.1 hypothetical protein BZL42_04925 [Pseudomonas indica]SDL69036.1 hypothetical protein SAMN05216186_12752 [Pseudomonas indica]
MSFDQNAFQTLLRQAREHADNAAAQNDPLLYRDAFLATLQALEMVAGEAGGWREMVVRATEEYMGDEGI